MALIERLSGSGYERSLVYSGPRGVGKTVLVMEYSQARPAGRPPTCKRSAPSPIRLTCSVRPHGVVRLSN